MASSARVAASSDGFTLLEVILAVSVLATAAAAIMAIYVRSIDQATNARDLTYAVSIARNALNEELAGITKEAKDLNYVVRPSLVVTCTTTEPADKTVLTTLVKSEVTDRTTSEVVIGYAAKKAVYEAPEEETKPDENGQNKAKDTNAADTGGTDSEGGQSSNDATN